LANSFKNRERDYAGFINKSSILAERLICALGRVTIVDEVSTTRQLMPDWMRLYTNPPVQKEATLKRETAIA
jgi:hypothetical protein